MPTKLLKIFIAICSFAFIYWYTCQCNDNNCFNQTGKKALKISAEAPFKVTEPKGSTLLQSIHNIKFLKGKSAPIIAPETSKNLDLLVSHLEKNNGILLEVFLNDLNEENTLEHKKINQDRKNEILALFSKLQNSDSRIKFISNQKIPAISFKDTLYNLVEFQIAKIADPNKQVEIINSGIQFSLKDSLVNFSLGAKNEIKKIKDYLTKNSSKQLEVIAGFNKNNNNDNREKGLQRANSLKDYLIKSGISKEQIDIVPPIGKVVKPELLLMDKNRLSDEALKLVLESKQTLYFATGNSELNLSQQQITYFQYCRKYLKLNPAKIALLMGHTDNVGNPTRNVVLGRKRAQAVKKQLAQMGIPLEQINVESKGQESPAQSNDTAEGRKFNRRVVISIK